MCNCNKVTSQSYNCVPQFFQLPTTMTNWSTFNPSPINKYVPFWNMNPAFAQVFANLDIPGAAEMASNQPFIPMSPAAKQDFLTHCYQQGEKSGLMSTISNVNSRLESFKAGLTAVIKDKNIEGQNKQKLQALLAETEAEIAKLKQVAQKAAKSEISNEEIKAELEAIQGKFVEIQTKTTTLSEKIAIEFQSKEGTDDNEEGEDVSSSSSSSTSSSTSSSSTSTSTVAIRKKAGLVTPSNAEVRGICSDIKSAVNYFWGTDDEKMENAISRINKDNVMEVMKYWQDNGIEQSKSGGHDVGGTIIHRIMNDAGHYEKKNWMRPILEAMMERADALGISDKVGQEYSAIDAELDECNISKNITARNFAEMYKKIEAAEKGSQAKSTEAATSTTDADKAKKISENNNTLRYNFMTDFNDDLKNRGKEKVSKVPSRVQEVKDASGNITFNIRYNNKDYSATTYSGLVEIIRKDDANFQLEDLK